MDKYAPKALKAYHIKGRYDGLPQEFGERADIYLYQSGHNPKAQEITVELAESFAGRLPHHPVVNSEPCYEQMGYSHHIYGRFHRCDIRKALWNSLLSGADAGITYGAHGVWNWFKTDMPRNPIGGEGFLRAMTVSRALKFPGAKDYVFARQLFEERDIINLVPCQEILTKFQDHVRAARTEKEILIYLPVTAPLILQGDYSGYHASVIDLTTRESRSISMECEENLTMLEMHEYEEDVLIILE